MSETRDIEVVKRDLRCDLASCFLASYDDSYFHQSIEATVDSIIAAIEAVIQQRVREETP